MKQDFIEFPTLQYVYCIHCMGLTVGLGKQRQFGSHTILHMCYIEQGSPDTCLWIGESSLGLFRLWPLPWIRALPSSSLT